MKTKTPWRALFGALIVLAATTSGFGQIWNFNSGSEGWQINDLVGSGNYTTSLGTSATTWQATGGSPGGYISGLDPSSNTFMFQAPVALLGNYSLYLGGTLSFFLQTNLVADYSADSVVVFRGGASNLTIVAPIAPQPGSSWSQYTIGLTANQFRYDNLGGATVSTADFASVFGNLNTFLINAEYHNGIEETTGLDSVAFVAPNLGAVPEPSTYGLIGAIGLAGLGVARRIRRYHAASK